VLDEFGEPDHHVPARRRCRRLEPVPCLDLSRGQHAGVALEDIALAIVGGRK